MQVLGDLPEPSIDVAHVDHEAWRAIAAELAQRLKAMQPGHENVPVITVPDRDRILQADLLDRVDQGLDGLRINRAATFRDVDVIDRQGGDVLHADGHHARSRDACHARLFATVMPMRFALS